VKLDDPVQYIKGVGPRRAEVLGKGGFSSIEDLLFHLPFRYEDRRRIVRACEAAVGDEVTLVGRISGVREVRMRRRRGPSMLQAIFDDGTGAVALVWFHQASFFKNKIDGSERWLVHGRLERGRRGAVQIIHPEIDAVDEGSDGTDVARIVPVYQKPTDLPVAAMRGIIERVVEGVVSQVRSAVPDAVRERLELMPLADALRAAHSPPVEVDCDDLQALATPWHRTLILEELFTLQVGMSLRRMSREALVGNVMPETPAFTDEFVALLPFSLTGAQQRVILEIAADLAKPHPMNRLVHGDVGSGKTVVAFAAALQAMKAGYQVAVMAPTELLAEQHFRTMAEWAEALAIRIAMLSGSMRGAAAATVRDQLKVGDLDLVVGTHALVQDDTGFAKLGLAIIDEQHRFGVMQRAVLKGEGIDTLLLSATPIPRTLALALYGDVDVSFLDEMPAGRKPVTTRVIRASARAKLYERMAAALQSGTQCYVVYPLVEESELMELADATSKAEQLQAGVFKDYRVGLLHGRMKPAEKDAVMRRFKAGDIHVLVATTVIEVGIDVPNATIMVVEHAERFGLAQLHQLRGRVGRGGGDAFCCLVADQAQGPDSYERLRVMETTTDGFEVAEADLRLRGPGEYLGTRQAGAPAFRAANLVRDAELLELARQEAAAWLAKDPMLKSHESAELKCTLERRWGEKLALAEVG